MTPISNAEIQAHLNAHDIKVPQAAANIKRELDQYLLPGFQLSYQDGFFPKDRSFVEKVRAEALRNPHSPQRLAEAFKEGDVISSILPDYIKGVIPSFNIVGAVIEKPEDFAKLTWTLRTPYMEVLKVAFLNRNKKAVHSATLSVGAINVTFMNPQMVLRELQRIAGKTNANQVILSHNHPSGDPSPSSDDLRSTEIVVKGLKIAGIDLSDHVITNGKKYASWKQEWAVLPIETPQPEWEVVPRTELPMINHTDDLKEIIASLRQADPHHDHVIYGDTRLHVTAVERLPSSLSVDELALRIAHGSGREGAPHVWFESVRRELPDIQRLRTALEQVEIRLLDAGTSSYQSLKAMNLMETVSEKEIDHVLDSVRRRPQKRAEKEKDVGMER
ncbi:MAG: JAB domain-containing protein [Verrucomicrobiae bacterium]|nr:JAB domain-containing protein [Verrucomicrobiae bacterium]